MKPNPDYMGENGQDLVDGKKEPKRRAPSLMQRRLFMEIASGRHKSLRKAAKAAGFSDKTHTSALVKKLSETTLRSEMEALGLTPATVAQRLMDGLDGDTVKPIGGGEYVTIPDWTNRHRYLTTAMRIFGLQVTGVPRETNIRDNSIHLTTYKNVFQMMDKSLAVAASEQVHHEIEEADEDLA